MDSFDELSLTECWDFLAEVISSDPFVKHFPETFAYLAKNWEQDSPAAQAYRPNGRLWYLYSGDRRGGLKLRPGYRRRYADAYCAMITLPCWSRNKLTLLHELAHICCGCDVQRGAYVSAHGKSLRVFIFGSCSKHWENLQKKRCLLPCSSTK